VGKHGLGIDKRKRSFADRHNHRREEIGELQAWAPVAKYLRSSVEALRPLRGALNL